MMNASQFQKHAEKMFPVVPHMGLSVGKLNEQECVLFGKLAANKNHLGTAFGGSLYCFAALSCYGVLWAALSKINLQREIVISEGNIRYTKPVKSDFEVRCVLAPQDMLNFKSRVALSAQIMSQGEICAHFTGTYVALKN
jgi:thioesterase domain-containing protein